MRHIFNLPEAEAEGSFEGRPVHKINFGEKQLFSNLNERRAALHSAVLIKLNPDDHVRVKWSKLKQELIEKRHFKDTGEVSPTHRGQFRVYSGQESTPETLEIFFKPNVYPFGVLGIRGKELVCLASGGLSGRIGNTLDGITRIMFDFFGCEDAIVLDEGYDTFQIANLNRNGNGQTPEYSNEALLEKALQFTKQRLEADHGESLAEAKRQTAADPSYRYPDGLKSYPLNSQIVRDVESASIDASVSCEDVLVVKPHRSQMRSVLIFAVKKHPR